MASILIFFLVLFVLILVHEWGHFITAKKTGMRVDEFAIGFPPKLFGIKKGETEYTFNAIPVGGFVRIWGENGSEDSAALTPEEKSRAFDNRPKWAQAVVLLAGVVMNIILAWFLFTVTFIIGTPTAIEESAASPAAQLYIVETIPDSPASVLPTGAIVESVTYNGTSLETITPTSFSEAVQAAAPAPLEIIYTYKNEQTTATIYPTQNLDEANPEKYLVGASLTLVETIHKPILEAVTDGFLATWNGLVGITTGLFTLLSSAIVGEGDLTQVAGPIGIVGMVGEAASFGLTALLTFTAIISLNLAVINLLPIPALDGGRLVFVAIEAIMGRKIPPVWAGRVNFAGFALLMLLMVAVTYNDIVRLF